MRRGVKRKKRVAQLFEKEGVEPADKPGSVVGNHSSGATVADHL